MIKYIISLIITVFIVLILRYFNIDEFLVGWISALCCVKIIDFIKDIQKEL
jgi:hypothetical protein